MRDVINAITNASGGVTVGGAATGQLIIAGIGLVFMVAFGFWGAYLRWKDSKAIREAIDSGDLRSALKIRGK